MAGRGRTTASAAAVDSRQMDPGLRRIVLARLEADGARADGWSDVVLGDLEGRDGLEAQLAGSAASPRPLAAPPTPAATGTLLRPVALAGLPAIGRPPPLPPAP